MTADRFGVSFQGDGHVLKLMKVMILQLSEYTRNYSTVYFKWVNFMKCEIYHSQAVGQKSK